MKMTWKQDLTVHHHWESHPQKDCYFDKKGYPIYKGTNYIRKERNFLHEKRSCGQVTLNPIVTKQRWILQKTSSNMWANLMLQKQCSFARTSYATNMFPFTERKAAVKTILPYIRYGKLLKKDTILNRLLSTSSWKKLHFFYRLRAY